MAKNPRSPGKNGRLRKMDGPGTNARMRWVSNLQLESHTQHRLLGELALSCHPTGLVWRRIDRLAIHSQMGESTVRRHLDALEDMGLIERVRVRSQGRLRNYVYRVMVPGAGAIRFTDLPPFARQPSLLPDAWKQPLPTDASVPTVAYDDGGWDEPDDGDLPDETPVTAVPDDEPAGQNDEPAGQDGLDVEVTVEIIDPPTADDDDVPAGEVFDAEIVDDSPVAPPTPLFPDPAPAPQGAVPAVQTQPAVPAPAPTPAADPQMPQIDLSDRDVWALFTDEGTYEPSADQIELLDQIIASGPCGSPAQCKAAAGDVLGYYLRWRQERGVPRPSANSWIAQIRRMITAKLSEGYDPLTCLWAVIAWHDNNAQRHYSGRSVSPPGAITYQLERLAVNGVRHGIDGAGLTRDQANYRDELDSLDQLTQQLRAAGL